MPKSNQFFKVGDEIKLLHDTFYLSTKKTYVVRDVYRTSGDDQLVFLEGENGGWVADSFKLVTPTFTVNYTPPTFDTIDAAVAYATKLAGVTGVNVEVICEGR